MFWKTDLRRIDLVESITRETVGVYKLMRHNRTIMRVSTFALMFMMMTGASLASEDWRQSVGIFRIGLVSVGDAASTSLKSEPFRLAIAEALNIDVEIFPAKNAAVLVDAITSGRIEYAVMPTSTFALAHTACECVEPIVVPRSIDSTDSYRQVLITRSSEGAKLEDISKGKILAAGFDGTLGAAFAGYQVSVNGDAVLSPSTFDLRESAQLAEEAFLLNERGAILGWSSLTGNPSNGYSRGTLRRLVEQSGRSVSDFNIVWQSPEIPHRPHVVRKNLAREVKQLLQAVLLTLNENDPVAYDSIEPDFALGFSTTSLTKFQPVIDFLNSDYAREWLDKKSPSQ